MAGLMISKRKTMEASSKSLYEDCMALSSSMNYAYFQLLSCKCSEIPEFKWHAIGRVQCVCSLAASCIDSIVQ